jgi:thioredoxin 1
MFIIKPDNFVQLKGSAQPVIIDAYATWCGPCTYMKPIFHKIAQEHGDQYTFAELNVDEARSVAIELGVSSVPTFIFMLTGKAVSKVTGAMKEEDFLKKMDQAFGPRVADNG